MNLILAKTWNEDSEGITDRMLDTLLHLRAISDIQHDALIQMTGQLDDVCTYLEQAGKDE